MFETKINESTTEITFPFLDRHNDYIQLYVNQLEQGQFLVTDDGYTIKDLELSGVEVSNSSSRKKIFNLTLNRLGVSYDAKSHQLYIESSYKYLASAQHRLAQAMLDVNNMFMLSRSSVQSLFIEDVVRFFDDNNIFYSKDIQVMGKSKLEHHYDFLMNPTSTQPERFIKTLNVPAKSEVERIIFSWFDTYGLRGQGNKKTKLIVMMNDQEKIIRQDFIEALGQYEIESIPWSKREEKMSLLVS